MEKHQLPNTAFDKRCFNKRLKSGNQWMLSFKSSTMVYGSSSVYHCTPGISSISGKICYNHHQTQRWIFSNPDAFDGQQNIYQAEKKNTVYVLTCFYSSTYVHIGSQWPNMLNTINGGFINFSHFFLVKAIFQVQIKFMPKKVQIKFEQPKIDCNGMVIQLPYWGSYGPLNSKLSYKY